MPDWYKPTAEEIYEGWRNAITRQERERTPMEPCPKCNRPMVMIAGSKSAVCRGCGYREPCC